MFKNILLVISISNQMLRVWFTVQVMCLASWALVYRLVKTLTAQETRSKHFMSPPNFFKGKYCLFLIHIGKKLLVQYVGIKSSFSELNTVKLKSPTNYNVIYLNLGIGWPYLSKLILPKEPLKLCMEKECLLQNPLYITNHIGIPQIFIFTSLTR